MENKLLNQFNQIISKCSKGLQEKMHTLNDEQKDAMLKMMLGQNCFITGDAGVGKSYVINLFNEWCKEGKRHLLKTAPTGKASVNIGGVTAHSLFQLPINTEEMIQPTTKLPPKVKENLKFADRIVIDECSMLRLDAFEKIMEQIQIMNNQKIKEGKRPIQVILVGDFGQLPPVITKEDKAILNEHYGKDVGNGYCFQSKMWNEMGFETISFKQIVRQEDKEFAEALTQCKYGDNSCIDYFNNNFKSVPNENAIWLYGKNNSAFKKNQECMEKLPSRLRKLETEFNGNLTADDGIVDKELWLKEGCRILITANDKSSADGKMRYYNGSMGNLLKINDNKLLVRVDDTNEVVEIEKIKYEKKEYRPETISEIHKVPVIDEYGNKTIQEQEVEKTISKLTETGYALQFPVKVGYAITVHKSQGMTLDKVNYKPEVFADGQFYVAMSRCKDIHNLYCDGKVNSRMIKTSSEFLKFIENPNEYSFFSNEDVQKHNNKANGVDDYQLSLMDMPFEKKTKKASGFKLNAFKNKFSNDVPEQKEVEQFDEKENISEQKDFSKVDKEIMLGKILDSFASKEVNNNKHINISDLETLVNADDRIADAIYKTLIDCVITMRKETENDKTVEDFEDFENFDDELELF